MINFAAKLRTFYQKSNMGRVFFMFLLLELAYIKSYAQFFTIMPDSGQSTRLADETAYGDSVNIPLVLHSDTIRTEADSLMMAKREENLFPSTKGLRKESAGIWTREKQPPFAASRTTGDGLPPLGLHDCQLQIRLPKGSCI